MPSVPQVKSRLAARHTPISWWIRFWFDHGAVVTVALGFPAFLGLVLIYAQIVEQWPAVYLAGATLAAVWPVYSGWQLLKARRRQAATVSRETSQ